MALHIVFESNLPNIALHLFGKGLIAKAICEKVVKGVTGTATSQLAAELVLAVNATCPEDFWKYVAVIEVFDSSLAEEMKQEFEGEQTCFEQKLFSAIWHSHIL